MTRLLQPDPQTSESKGLSRWLTAEEHAVLRAAVADSAELVHPGILAPDLLSDAQVRDQGSLFGCLPEEKSNG